MTTRGKDVLRGLVERKAAIAALPIHKERAELWRRLNDLQRVKPMVWITEVPWNEMGIEAELQCEDAFFRQIEYELRRTLYQWDHVQGDMIVEDCIWCPLAVHDTGYGISEDARTIQPREGSVLAREYHPQIQSEADVAKIKDPQVAHDEAETERRFQQMNELFGDIMPVKKRGVPGFGFAPWDQLITWWGVQQAMMDLVEKPELVKMAMDRLVSAHESRLNQYEHLNVLARNDTNVRVGSGAYGYTNELPQEDFDPSHVRPCDMWGFATAQIFSDVSPPMHAEFALDFERRILDRFGLTYYGCCEPLDNKMDLLGTLPNLRKISMSPWINTERAAERLGNRYVFSRKPNPAVVAGSKWDPATAEKELRDCLDRTRGCVVEVVLKDISTVNGEPHRLWEWADMAARVTEEYA